MSNETERLRAEAAQAYADLVQARIEAGVLDAALDVARALLREAAAALGADWRIADDRALAAKIREAVGDD